MNRITLEVGDWSNDGHGKSDTFIVGSSLNKGDLWEAYKKGSEKLGLDLSNDVAVEYEDSSIKRDHWDTLVMAGFDEKESDHIIERADTEIYLSPEVFTKIWMFICKLGNPKLKIKIIKSNDWIDIGGYGLYY